MAESANSVAPIPPSSDIVAAQHAQLSTIGAANNAAFLSEVVQANLENDLVAPNTQQSPTPNDFSTNDPLLSIDTPTLSLLNEIAADPRSENITGNLTPQQIQDLGILLKDEQALEDAANIESPLPLGNAAATVDLSVEAQSILSGVNALVSVNALTSLTPLQLKQMGTILAPLINEPLTPTLMQQIQDQLNATGLNPSQFSLNTLVLVMNFMAAMQPAPTHVREENRNNQAESVDDETVAPTSLTGRVAVEDSKILGG